jgi:hypothetical protein
VEPEIKKAIPAQNKTPQTQAGNLVLWADFNKIAAESSVLSH